MCQALLEPTGALPLSEWRGRWSGWGGGRREGEEGKGKKGGGRREVGRGAEEGETVIGI